MITISIPDFVAYCIALAIVVKAALNAVEAYYMFKKRRDR